MIEDLDNGVSELLPKIQLILSKFEYMDYELLKESFNGTSRFEHKICNQNLSNSIFIQETKKSRAIHW